MRLYILKLYGHLKGLPLGMNKSILLVTELVSQVPLTSKPEHAPEMCLSFVRVLRDVQSKGGFGAVSKLL